MEQRKKTLIFPNRYGVSLASKGVALRFSQRLEIKNSLTSAF